MKLDKIGKAIAKGKAKAPKELTLADIERVKTNKGLMRQMSLESGFKAMMSGQDKLLVRKMALDTLPLARQKEKGLTLEKWMERLIKIINSRRAETRKQLLTAVRQQYEK